ncbi:PREDICTED: myb-related protein B-like [Nelumbo nucifera]|uniref:Uncharacterized protein n=2 Tax=Nelumbo nucifera TaxID=4432 RepID=A0A822XJ98_NELNU|nr:PREDICTED: myb-related protein B-like [Nelumbo nucifera]DAD20470.1 TPA_asm: hypothetical protein HUJ06_021933 [Nelumbo nucifera]
MMMSNNNNNNNGAAAATTEDTSTGSGAGGGLKKGPWTAAEDAILIEYVKRHGEGNWNAVQKNSGLSRCGKSCRLRWANHLRPNLKKGSFSPDEERLILELHSKLGNKWARMAAQLPGRTDNEIKNYWNTRVKRRQRAGLPLYPQDIQKRATACNLNQHHQPHLSPSPPPPVQLSMTQQPKQNYGSPLSLFDSVNIPMTTPLIAQHSAPLLPTPIHRFKQLRDNNNAGFSFSSSPPTPLPPSSSLFGESLSTQLPPIPSLQFNSGHFDLNPPTILQTPFEPDGITPSGSAFSTKMELPSSQLPQPAATAAASGTTNDYKIPPLARSNSGLLDALLQEAQTMAACDEDSRREGLSGDKCGLNGLLGNALPSGLVFSELGSVSQWDESNSAHSSIGAKTKTEPINEINSVLDDDLSGLLDIIPSTMSVPEWHSDSGEISNGQSSGLTDDDIGLEMQQLASSLSTASATTTDPDWTLGSCSWNNMPGIC